MNLKTVDSNDSSVRVYDCFLLHFWKYCIALDTLIRYRENTNHLIEVFQKKPPQETMFLKICFRIDDSPNEMNKKTA